MEIKEVEKKEDIIKVSELARIIWEEHFTKIIGSEQVDYMLDKFLSLKAIETCIKEENYRFFSLLEGREHIGFFSLRPDPDMLFLSKLYVRKECRGQGYSTLAMKAIERIAKDSDYDTIWLTCNKYNANTLAIYEHFGFTIFKDEVSDIGNGYVMDDYFLKKQL